LIYTKEFKITHFLYKLLLKNPQKKQLIMNALLLKQ